MFASNATQYGKARLLLFEVLLAQINSHINQRRMLLPLLTWRLSNQHNDKLSISLLDANERNQIFKSPSGEIATQTSCNANLKHCELSAET